MVLGVKVEDAWKRSEYFFIWFLLNFKLLVLVRAIADSCCCTERYCTV